MCTKFGGGTSKDETVADMEVLDLKKLSTNAVAVLDRWEIVLDGWKYLRSHCSTYRAQNNVRTQPADAVAGAQQEMLQNRYRHKLESLQAEHFKRKASE
jgi:hypothetical protein